VEHQFAQSVNVRSVVYDSEAMMPDAQFHSPAIDPCLGVPAHVYMGVRDTPPKGRFQSQHVKGQHTLRQAQLGTARYDHQVR